VTSGVVGALRLVEQLAGVAEAERVGRDIAYPDWSAEGSTQIAEQRLAITDLPYALNAAFPWARPTVGIGLLDGVGEIDVAAVFELYSATSSATRTVPVSSHPLVTTRHGAVLLPRRTDHDTPSMERLVVPGARYGAVDGELARWADDHGLSIEMPHRERPAGEFSFDAVLRDLAAHTDRATARTAAKFTEYPAGHLQLDGRAWPWRPAALLVTAVLLSIAVGLLTTTIIPRRMAGWMRRRRGRDQRGALS
jgi:hypothetical protein